MVVIAEGTRRLVGNLFELEDLGTKDLKGISGPVRAFAALRASSAEGRFEALHAAGLTALVGREEETELLLRRWSRTKSREGQVVLLSGGHRQITARGRAAGTPGRRAAHPLALFLLAAAHRQRVLSDHRADGTRRWPRPRRHGASEARQARCGSGADLDLQAGRRTLRRAAVAAKTTGAFRRSNWLPSNAGRRRWRRSIRKLRH
jgi:hypothetical protein